MNEYSDELIQEIKDKVDIVELISEHVPLQKKGREYFGKCPFHDEKTGSFSVTPHKKMYYCFGCKKGGDVINFCQEYMNKSYEDAIKYLGGIAGISTRKTAISDTVKYLKKATKKKKRTEPEIHLKLDKRILDTYEKRPITKWIQEGIPQDVMDKYKVMYDKRANRIVYPVYDNDGNLINIKGRTLYDNYKQLGIPKYINYYPVGDLDYFQGLCFKKNAIQNSKEVIIFESFKSVLLLDSYGNPNSISSETSQITIFQARTLIQMHKDIVIAYDADVSLEEIKKKENIQLLRRFTNVYAIIDEKRLLGSPKEKNAPVDKGQKIWEELYNNYKVKL